MPRRQNEVLPMTHSFLDPYVRLLLTAARLEYPDQECWIDIIQWMWDDDCTFSIVSEEVAKHE